MFKIISLSNKAQAILAPRQDTEAVTLLVLFKVGSRDEQKNINGISHFIEHLFFKGTKSRPTTLALSQELDKIGASFNAFTGKDYTGYYIKVAKDKISIAFDILSDMLFNSLFKLSEIEREKGVITQEIKMYRDNPLMHIGFLLEGLVYQGHSLAMDEGGPAKTVQSLTRKQIIDYRDKYYFTDNMIVGVAGNFQEKKVKQLLANYFGKKRKQTVKNNRQSFNDSQKQARVKVHYQKTEQVQMALGFSSMGVKDPNYVAQLVLATLLGGTMSSRLFINVRERNGLAYFIKASVDDHQDTSTFYIQAGLNKEKMELAYDLIIKELKNLKTKLVSAAELAKAKDYLTGKLSINLEDSFDYIFWLIRQYIDHNEIKDVDEVKKKIQAVTVEQIKQVAMQVFQGHKQNLAIIGPYKNSIYFNKLVNKKTL